MSRHIDELSKSLADESMSRRQSFRRFGAALAGALLGPLGLQTARAGPSDPCKAFCNQCPKWQRAQCLADCRACLQAGGHLCGTCGGYGCCGDGQTCCGGQACCGDGQTCCGDYCADLDNDIDNCGACGHECDDPGINGYAVCDSGTCQYFFCGPYTDYNWDSNNCGRCGNVCPWGSACAFGICGSSGGGDG
jgi:hypothetical protein